MNNLSDMNELENYVKKISVLGMFISETERLLYYELNFKS